mmetsp:Transcript_21221/g.41503  ORF Transcript_21221/g.41503 Transcript_21221/m.41503 type:complete len:203 (+) Transcript_21221:77-685(+)
MEISYAPHGRSRLLKLPGELVTDIPVISPPGYAGHAPGVYAGNVFGHTHAMSNLHGILHAHSQRATQGLPSPRRRFHSEHRAQGLSLGGQARPEAVFEDTTSVSRVYSSRPDMTPRLRSVGAIGHRYPEGAKVPGYSGFVPGVAAGNLIAVATPRAARNQWQPDASYAAAQLNSRNVDPSTLPSAGKGRQLYGYGEREDWES